MSSKMTGVYSGGLMYEYTMEKNGFGIVEESGGEIETLPEFDNLAKAMAEYPAPSGDGGAAATTHSVPCPTRDSTWEVDSDAIPAMPQEAEKYMKDGAGKGKGMKGPGSQTAGNSGLSTSNVTGGEASPGADAAHGMIGSFDVAPLLVTAATLAFTVFGAILL